MDFEKGHQYTKQENLSRMLKLQALIRHQGFGYKRIQGEYLEKDIMKKFNIAAPNEESFFVINLTNNKSFVEMIAEMGECFNQDSVLIKKKGKDAHLFYTNTTKDEKGNSRYGSIDNAGDFRTCVNDEFISSFENYSIIYYLKKREIYMQTL